MIYESALREFVKATPKYAGSTAAFLIGTAAISTALIGVHVAQKVTETEQLKKVHVSAEDITNFLLAEIESREASITTKQKTIHQLENEVANEQKRIDELLSLIEHISVESEGGAEENEV